ncbi:MAG TPA: hemolysin family protein [Marmoricola sp.]
MTLSNPGLVVLVVGLVLIAGVLSAADAALSSFSRARAAELADEGRAGAVRLAKVLDDPAPVLSTVLLLRTLFEIAAVVLATLMITGTYGRDLGAICIAVAVMVVVSFVVLGVAPRTLGRQHSEAVALASAPVLRVVTGVFGPVPRLLILVGNALTPGRGFSEGPFASETELREMVDLAEASSVIESDERNMIHSVFELGDTAVREVMVPRTDVVYIERHKTLRQAMSLFLRSGFSRLPVVGEDLDDIVGFAYLKDLSKRVYDRSDAQTTELVDSLMRSVLHVPDSKPVDDLLRDMQAARRHIAVVVDEYGGTAGLVTIEDVLEEIVGEITDEFDADEVLVEHLADGSVRISSRYPVDDLDELFDLDSLDSLGLSDDDVEDVDSVGGLMAKHLGVVPIPGSEVSVGALTLTAEGVAGRRKKINTVLLRRTD